MHSTDLVGLMQRHSDFWWTFSIANMRSNVESSRHNQGFATRSSYRNYDEQIKESSRKNQHRFML
jgi:hypothetical protein